MDIMIMALVIPQAFWVILLKAGSSFIIALLNDGTKV